MDDAAPVIQALKDKDVKRLDALLRERPARADARTPEGMSALQLAAYLRFAAGVRALREAGAQPDVWAAAALGDVERLRALAAQDRTLVAKPGPDGAAPLHLAAHFGQLDALRALLNLGAPVDGMAGGQFRNAPLHAAAAGAQGEAIALLLAAGADPSLADGNGYLPLHVAAANGSVRGVEALLAGKADPRARGPGGKTALDFARERGMDEVEALLAPRILENDPANPCVGCGPEHPHGLRLVFAREGAEVTSSLDATRERQGWPDRLHSGLLYLALLETANWTLYGLRGRVGIPVRTSALDAQRWIAVGERLTLHGRLARDEPQSVTVAVEARDASGARVASLERAYDLPDRATFLKRMGYDRAPPGLEDALPP
ncbi:MAG: uncharacterized protein QOE90_1005 [Thermoplasmata archaeon]|jgi:hypothetical protein|nr:uncharacterized protein [Thermoplasmata archaeon]